MALPLTREQFKDKVMRGLGFPVIEINITDEQLEDRIDDALQYYQDYHFDGQEHVYYKHQITTDDIKNQYITIPDNIVGITKLIDGAAATSANYLFNVNYQFALNDFFNITSTSVVPYYLAIRHINMFQDLFTATPGLRFNQKTNKVYINGSWENYQAGQYLVLEGYQLLDPDENPEVWSDRWLFRYATVLVKKQWGQNIGKYDNIQLLGGITMNGAKYYDQAVTEQKEIEEEMINNFSMPLTDFIGPSGM